jgi:hypothetical protein
MGVITAIAALIATHRNHQGGSVPCPIALSTK